MPDWPDSRTLGVVLYPGFDLMDVTGPLHAFGMLKNVFEQILVAEAPGAVESAQGPELVAHESFSAAPKLDMLLVPGGAGSRRAVQDEGLLRWLGERGIAAEISMSVGAGAGLLAQAGLLDGRRATTSTRASEWVAAQGPKARWVRAARWVDDGDVVTAAGAASGLDMALHVITRLTADDVGENVARSLEHPWNSQKAKPKKGLRAFGIVVMLLLAGFSAVIALFGTCAAVVAGGAFAPFGDLHDFFFIGIALGLLAGILAFVAVCRTIIKRRGWNSQTRSVAIDSTPMQVILTANIGDARFSSVPSAAADRSGPAKHRYTIAAVCCWVLAAALTCSTQFVDGFPILFGGVIAAVVGIVCGIVSASVSQPRRTELVWITVAIVLNFATLLLLAGFLLAEAMGRIA